MAQTKIKANQLGNSTNPGSIIASNSSNIFEIVSSSPGADHLFFYDHSATAIVPLTIGTNLSITGTTLNASAGAGGYVTIQEEGSDLTAQTKLNFVGSGFTATNDGANSRTNVTLNSFLNTLATQGNVSLSGSDVTNTLPATKGGTGTATTAVGDLLVGAASNTWNKLTIGGSGTFLKSNGTTASWASIASTDLSNSANIALLNATQTFTNTITFSNAPQYAGTPSAGNDLTNVTYVTNSINTALAGIRKGSVRVATTGPGTLATSFENGDSVDGVTLATGDLILIKNQVAPGENGVYTVNASGAPTRATWMDAASEIDGVYVAVEDGVTNGGTIWITVSEVTNLGTDSIVFTQIQTSGAVASVTLTQPAAGLTLTNSGSTQTGAVTSTFALANDLAAVEGLASNGIATRTATDTWTVRTMTGTSNRITITNGDGISGNPTFDISSSYVGQATITTLGTITTGTWTGTAIAATSGGTGQTTTAVGDLLVGAASNTWSKVTIGSSGTVLKSNGTTASWGSATPTITRAYLTGSTSSVIDLDSGTAVTDIDGSNITFTVPTDLELVFVVRNGVLLSRSGTVSRDYTLVSATGVLTLASALTTDENLMVYKFS